MDGDDGYIEGGHEDCSPLRKYCLSILDCVKRGNVIGTFISVAIAIIDSPCIPHYGRNSRSSIRGRGKDYVVIIKRYFRVSLGLLLWERYYL